MEATVQNPVEELRKAASKLRCEHTCPMEPPHGSLASPGPCTGCGTSWADLLLLYKNVGEGLREPLADLLDGFAEIDGKNSHAVAVARVILGGAR